MNIITYPLNGVTYDAEDVGTHLCTRTSGVYAKDTNYAVSITGARELTVAPGLAWINYEDFKGVSVCSREAVTLDVPAADTTLPRVDRIVLQFDVDANASAVKLKPGTPSAAPEPPAIQQNHRQYELGLATLNVPAGTASITVANLTDTRTDEDVCGIMRDGVTGIPTAQLLEQWQAAQAQQDAEARQAAAEMLRAAQERITAQLDSLQQQADDLKTAIDNVESGRFYTKSEVDALVRPYSLPAATSNTLGGIKVGDNLTIDADGRLSGAAPYALPAATTSTLGGVKAGSNLTVYADGTLALGKSGVTGALGYTPAQVTAGTYDLTAGSSYLSTGALYVQYATGTSDAAVDDTDIHMPEDESAQDGEPAEADEEVQA
nr:MAG TPA: Receptor Binding Protein [Caudoviricetes sp.]